MNSRLVAWLSTLMIISTSSPLRGGVVWEGPVESTLLGTARMVRVYVPPSYTRETARRYPVLYVHDGQNSFSTAGTNVAFGWGNWELDLTADRLVVERRMREIIIVAVDNTTNRYREYRGPARPAKTAAVAKPKPPLSTSPEDRRFEAYQQFLATELKPRIDRDYRTLPDPAHTALLGSSLGGICSLALAWRTPEVFGQAASFSGAYQIEGRYFLEQVLGAFHGRPKPLHLYLDCGVVDYTGGDDGRADTEAVVSELRRIGWRQGRNLEFYVDTPPLTIEELARSGLRQDKWEEARHSQHNEFYWRLRAWRALVFLFPWEASVAAGH